MADVTVTPEQREKLADAIVEALSAVAVEPHGEAVYRSAEPMWRVFYDILGTEPASQNGGPK